MADSQTLVEFKRAAGSGSWERAFSYCNGLSLYEMLRGLDSLSGEALLVMKRTAPSYVGRVGWERIAFAIAVVGEKKIGTFPGISAADRTEAQSFVTQKKNTLAASGSVDGSSLFPLAAKRGPCALAHWKRAAYSGQRANGPEQAPAVAGGSRLCRSVSQVMVDK